MVHNVPVVAEAGEVRAVFRDALMAMDQDFLDFVCVTVIVELKVPEQMATDLLIAAMHEVPTEVQAWWNQPCGVCP